MRFLSSYFRLGKWQIVCGYMRVYGSVHLLGVARMRDSGMFARVRVCYTECHMAIRQRNVWWEGLPSGERRRGNAP